jgi:hypothetical protein
VKSNTIICDFIASLIHELNREYYSDLNKRQYGNVMLISMKTDITRPDWPENEKLYYACFLLITTTLSQKKENLFSDSLKKLVLKSWRNVLTNSLF